METGVCPRCGEGVRPGESFCECCGQPLEAARCVRCGPAPVDPEGYCERCGLRQPAESDHVEVEAGGAAGVSDRGLRHARNEDAMALVAADGLTIGVVCDGVSSSPRPETASSTAAGTGAATLLAELRSGADPASATRAAVARAAAAVAALASSPEDAPACTYVSAVVEPGAITVGWVGDSRAYWLRAESPADRPADASAVPAGGPAASTAPVPESAPTVPMPVVPVPVASAPADDSALLTEDDTAAPGVLSAWLGADAGEVEAHVRTLAPEGPGVLLVCSDGLWGYLEEARALAPLATGDAPPEAARALVRHALAAGGRDNITVLVVPYGPPPGPAPADLGRNA
ncbi:PP2C family serine/threonine-protein phosphatase [Planobispora longispora]|uniref:PP2C family serine/threonine-protein phosphatase n=1 Tax=Planobispora longispora TaxID=28887 RepID=UPI001EF74C9E|nr:protein phosphatase 2C domain-containing protein [Planobispora longispora]